MKHISATSLKTFQTCPMQWMYKYDYELLQAPNPAFQIGSAYHKMVEEFHKGISVENILENTKKDIIKKKTNDEIDMFGLLRLMFVKYAENPIKGNTVKTEFRFNIPLPNLKVGLYGFIDRIVEGDRIVEYKTTSKDYIQEDVNNIQSHIYSYVYFKIYGKIPTVTYSVVNKKKIKQPNYRLQILEIKCTDKDLKTLETDCVNFYNDVQEKKFKANKGKHCFWCPYVNFCNK